MFHFRQDAAGKQAGSTGIEKKPKLFISRIVQTKAAKAASIMASLVLIFSMASPAPLSAHRYWNSNAPRYFSDIEYCFEQTAGWNTSALNVIRATFEHWDGYMTKRSITEVAPGFGCNIHVHITYGGAVGSAPARALPLTSGNQIISGDLLINANLTSQFWTYGASQNCNVPCPKPLDLWTISVHEIGHLIGLGHNMDTQPVLCSSGGFVDNPAPNCTNDWYSVDPMYWAAGDGYRRWIQADSLGGLVGLGYR